MLLLEPREFLDKAIVGTVHIGGIRKAVYSEEKTIIALMEYLDCDEEEAYDYFGYNTLRACEYYEDAPIFLNDVEDIDEPCGCGCDEEEEENPYEECDDCAEECRCGKSENED